MAGPWGERAGAHQSPRDFVAGLGVPSPPIFCPFVLGCLRLLMSIHQ